MLLAVIGTAALSLILSFLVRNGVILQRDDVMRRMIFGFPLRDVVLLVLGIAGKDLRWLNKPFVPMQITGFGFILGSLLTSLTKIDWAGVLVTVCSFPSILFFLAWVGLMGFMGWYRKNRFRHDDAHSNWTAQIINAVGQTCLLLGILFAG